MGNCCTSCIESINMLGPSTKVMKCKFCNKKKWRGNDTVEFFKMNGCFICRLTNRYQTNHLSDIEINQVINSAPKPIKGRYNNDFSISLKNSSLNNSSPSSSAFTQYATYKKRHYNAVGFKL